MKQVIVLLMICMPLLMKAQTDANYKGINFEEGLSWEQVKAKAKATNKYIFLDCYATWCGPCKQMDKNIYPDEAIGKKMNERFISVRVQFDKTEKDDDNIRSWYETADELNKEYNIPGYPTFLFFSPEGEIVHRYTGAAASSFHFAVSIVDPALDPSKQYYTLLAAYKAGKKDVAIMQELAKATKLAGDPQIADQMVNDYINSIDSEKPLKGEDLVFMSQFPDNIKVKEFVFDYKINHFDKLVEDSLYTKVNLYFVYSFSGVVSSKDKIFKILYDRPERANAVENDSSFSQNLVWRIVRSEEILDKLYKDGKPITAKPDWKAISNNLDRKYGSKYADKLTAEKLLFYNISNNWKEVAKLIGEQIRLHPPQKGGEEFTAHIGGPQFGDETALNENAWQVFLRCNDKTVIKKALQWTELSIKLSHPTSNVQFLDTRANLLYKLGRVNEAIVQEQQAIDFEIANAKKEGREPSSFLSDFISTINKMKRGETTLNGK